MNYLLDTNIVSETVRPAPNARVLAWLKEYAVKDAYLSVISLGEIEQGILRLGVTKRAVELNLFLKRLEDEFTGRILPIDRETMRVWAQLTSQLVSVGRTLPCDDSLLAATALTHHLTVVTRNVQDFQDTGILLLNPWEFDG